MMRAMWSAAAGMSVQQSNMDVISNNLANVNTTAYKKGRAEFQDLLYQTINLAGTGSSTSTNLPTGIQLGNGARLQAVARQYTTGSLKNTGGKLDLAIEGDGFFSVTQADGTLAYTRDGAFTIDQNGLMVTSDGLTLNPQIDQRSGGRRRDEPDSHQVCIGVGAQPCAAASDGDWPGDEKATGTGR